MVPTTPAVGTTSYSTSRYYNVSLTDTSSQSLPSASAPRRGRSLLGVWSRGTCEGHPPLLEEGREMPAVTELQVAIIERFHEKGSLKDYMHRVKGGLGSRRLNSMIIDL